MHGTCHADDALRNQGFGRGCGRMRHGGSAARWGNSPKGLVCRWNFRGTDPARRSGGVARPPGRMARSGGSHTLRGAKRKTPWAERPTAFFGASEVLGALVRAGHDERARVSGDRHGGALSGLAAAATATAATSGATAATSTATTSTTAASATLGGFGERDGHQTCCGEDRRECAHFAHLDLLIWVVRGRGWNTHLLHGACQEMTMLQIKHLAEMRRIAASRVDPIARGIGPNTSSH